MFFRGWGRRENLPVCLGIPGIESKEQKLSVCGFKEHRPSELFGRWWLLWVIYRSWAASSSHQQLAWGQASHAHPARKLRRSCFLLNRPVTRVCSVGT